MTLPLKHALGGPFLLPKFIKSGMCGFQKEESLLIF